MALKDFPEIDFLTADVQEVLDECIKIAEEFLGRKIGRADPIRILINVFVLIIIQLRLRIDWIAKQNLLAYAEGEYLEHLGALVGVSRLPDAYAVTTVEVALSAPRLQVTTIRKGTRITADNNVYFALDDDLVFQAGEVKKTCAATCLVSGAAGNNFAIGELNQIVDPQPFLMSIINITRSEGGADTESDENLRERIHEAPESFSVAGPEGAYKFWAKSASALISDVAVNSEQPTTVQIYVLLQEGEIPGEEMLNLVNQTLSDKTKRPLTDQLTVRAPQIVNFNIDLDYYIDREDEIRSVEIIENINVAIAEYVAWQRGKIGRDINPDELIHRLKTAGMKRAVIREPIFTQIGTFAVARAQNINFNFKGLEDD